MKRMLEIMAAIAMAAAFAGCATTSTIPNKNAVAAKSEVYVLQEKTIEDLVKTNASLEALQERQDETMKNVTGLVDELDKAIYAEKEQRYNEGFVDGYSKAIEDIKSNAKVEE